MRRSRTSRHRQRGQAIVETVIFGAVMVVALMTMIWAGRAAVVKTRAIQAVRYGGLIQDHYGLPYEVWSFFSMYETSGGRVWTDSTQCMPPPTSVLLGDPSTGASTRPKYWTPQNYTGTTYMAGSCNDNTGDNGRVAYTGSTHFTRDLLAYHDQQVMIAGVPAPSFIAHDAQNTAHAGASANFFRSPDNGTLIWCLHNMDAAVSPSLVPTWYAMNQTAPTPMPITVTATPPTVDTTCNGDAYIGGTSTTNGVTPPTPFPYSSPTPAATWGPSVTPSPGPSPAAAPSPVSTSVGPAPGGGTTSS